MSSQEYFVYIVASKNHGTLYTGVTSNLIKRIYEHTEGLVDGFTKKYQVHQLVYFERHTDIREAILREKSIKKWRREWKFNLIERDNPQWIDLYSEIIR
ncbi:MAG TPA: GIY-YIG nuclease family protein [Gammaproteobacteria bacterium]|nr:GIY-YIG nuclease family protein [Gammaproteobacteria bacterium]